MTVGMFYTCPDCGAHLDSQGEICECHKPQDANAELLAELAQKSEQLKEQIIAGIRKDMEIRKLRDELDVTRAELLREKNK